LGFGSYQVGPSRISGHLVSGYFGFKVISGRVGSDIGSSVFDHFGFRVVQCWIISGFESYRVRTGRADFSDRIGFYHL
jgi:hypothetical protein